jgi:hypothetical protein
MSPFASQAPTVRVLQIHQIKLLNVLSTWHLSDLRIDILDIIRTTLQSPVHRQVSGQIRQTVV